MTEEYIDGELLGVEDSKIPTLDKLSKVQWRTKENKLIYIKDLEDSHLRNIAMMIAGFGYQIFRAPDLTKVLWLTVLKMEWERRMIAKKFGFKRFIVYADKQKQGLLE